MKRGPYKSTPPEGDGGAAGPAVEGKVMEPAEIVRALPRQARARLKRHICGMCEIRLDRGWCSACYAPRCDTATMIKRMAACLAESRIEEVRRVAAELVK